MKNEINNNNKNKLKLLKIYQKIMIKKIKIIIDENNKNNEDLNMTIS